MRPIANVGSVPQVGKWLLRTSRPVLEYAQTVAEVNQELSVARPLDVWEYHDAAQIVFTTVFLFTKVPNDVVSISFALTQDVKVECIEFHCEVLVIKEQTRDVPKIFSVDFLLFGIEFKHRNFVITIYFIAWGTSNLAP